MLKYIQLPGSTCEPDDSSRVNDVLSPGTHFNILGFNASGSFIEIAKEGQSVASGWVTSSAVSRQPPGRLIPCT